jgi:hypothetical protein
LIWRSDSGGGRLGAHAAWQVSQAFMPLATLHKQRLKAAAATRHDGGR